jgi:tRNA(adenine34) deaminase
MCLGAILQSRIDCIAYGVNDSRYGAIETHLHKELVQKAYSRFPQVVNGILQNECKTLLKAFFKQIRRKN